jgi:hypothetical protein
MGMERRDRIPTNERQRQMQFSRVSGHRGVSSVQTGVGSLRRYATLLVFLGLAFATVAPAAHSQNAPKYKVDPFWPKPLPNRWSMQQIVDIYVDKEDHIWVLNRATDARPDELGAATNPPRAECCVLGPEVLEFDTDGSVLRAWGGKDYVPG